MYWSVRHFTARMTSGQPSDHAQPHKTIKWASLYLRFSYVAKIWDSSALQILLRTTFFSCRTFASSRPEANWSSALSPQRAASWAIAHLFSNCVKKQWILSPWVKWDSCIYYCSLHDNLRQTNVRKTVKFCLEQQLMIIVWKSSRNMK